MHHRESALSSHRKGGSRLRAGDRAPDVAVVSAGARTHLHRLLSMDHWTLLLRTHSDGSVAARCLHETVAPFKAQIRVASVAPVGKDAERALGWGSRDSHMLLVRPDGHIGLLARADDVRSLDDYLDAFLVRTPTTTGDNNLRAEEDRAQASNTEGTLRRN